MKRIKYLKIFFCLFALALIVRGAQLASGKDPRLARLAKRQFESKVSVLPRRGLVFDRNGEGLAISLKAHSLYFRPDLLRKEISLRDQRRIAEVLSRILEIPISQIQSKMSAQKSFVWVKRQLSTQAEAAIQDRGLLEYSDGIGLVEEAKRFYPGQSLASHVLGTVNVDGVGIEGLELFYENFLRGERVNIASTRDAMGRRIFRDEHGLAAFKDGRSLVLTIDKFIQYEAEKTLKTTVEQHKAHAGSAIVADVRNGEILALANYPTYDPNSVKSSSVDSRRNRAITDTFEPGSVFKPFIVGMALEQGHSPKTQIYCEEGKFKVADRVISEAESHEKFDWLNYGEIIKYSSNIGTAKIALNLGADKISQLLSLLQMGQQTGIDLPGEVSGSAQKKDLQSSVRRANIGFGHGITVTALQMLANYLAVANGGQWIQPKLVKAVLSEDPDSLQRGAIRYKLGARAGLGKVRNLFSKKTVRELTRMLETVVEEKGTGVSASLEDWRVAGKTGTAQKVDPLTKKYSHQKFISSFVGFAPSSKPALVVLVLLDEPQNRYYASDSAAPAFREIMQASLLREQVKSDKPKLETLGAQFTITSSSAIKKEVRMNQQFQKPEFHMPDLHKRTMREVLRVVSNHGLDLEITGNGILVEQFPPPDNWVLEGSKIKLVFSHEVQ